MSLTKFYIFLSKGKLRRILHKGAILRILQVAVFLRKRIPSRKRCYIVSRFNLKINIKFLKKCTFHRYNIEVLSISLYHNFICYNNGMSKII